MRTMLAVLVLVTTSCASSLSAASTTEASRPWQSFTGRPVPGDTQTYITGFDVTSAEQWLTQSWFTTGHSHTGLFKSGDDGKTWSQVLGWDGWPRWQKHFGAASAIVVAEFEQPGYRLHARLLSTTDGGRQWQARDLPVTDDSMIRSIYFVDANTGWLMLGLGSTGSIGCGQVKESIDILRTTDGGANWAEILSVDAEHPDAGGISIDGAKDGLSFASPTHGFLTTSWLDEGNVAYSTEDGGNNWTRLTLPFDQSPGVAFTSAPTWLSSSAGIINVKIGPRPLMGCQLQRGPVASPPPLSPGPWAVEAPSYLVAPNPGSLLLHTVDSGATWSTVAESSQWGDIASFAAIDEAHWAVANGDTLWLTADAGNTWKETGKVLDPRCSFALVRFANQTTGLASEFCQATAGVIEGCERGAEYKSDWDCPPIGTPLVASNDGGRTWIGAAKPILR